jgi:hypothetical protein
MSGETVNALPLRVVVLISTGGQIVTHFGTDREEFPLIATHDRDRIFKLIHKGELTKLRGMEMPHGITIHGAVYHEIEAWRISGRTIDKPRPSKRRRKSAKIYQFPMGGAA